MFPPIDIFVSEMSFLIYIYPYFIVFHNLITSEVLPRRS
jgi:hypothetical protein